jgi:Putative capsular polysaccharide synthesis protein
MIGAGLFTSNYLLAKTVAQVRFRLSERGQQPVLVYQMGKVGSSTVVQTLETAQLSSPIYHMHTLTTRGIHETEEHYYGDRLRSTSPSQWPNTKHLFVSHYLFKQLQQRGSNKKHWKIISLVRDPIARNISDFFENIEIFIPDYYARRRCNEITANVLSKYFLTQYPDHNVPLTWLDVELHSVFGVDVYATDFPKPCGYQIYAAKNADVLILRLESLATCLAPALKEFLGLPHGEPVNANQAANKEYYTAYREFRSQTTIPAAYLDRMYTSRYAQHFYTPEELNGFRAKWSSSIPQ